MKIRRKLIYALLILCMSIISNGCSNSDENEVEQKAETNEEESVEATENTIEEEKKTLTGFSTIHTIEDAKDGYFIVKMESGLCQLLDMNGSEVSPFVEVATMSFPQSKDAEAVIIVNGKKAGLMDYSGNEILPLEYDFIRNWGCNSEYYLVQKDGIQSIVGMDGTLVKELSGTYGALIGDSFLIDGEIRTVQEFILPSGNIYSLDEELIRTDANDIEIYADGSAKIYESGMVETDYNLNNFYFDIEWADGTVGEGNIKIVNADGNTVLSLPGYGNRNINGNVEWYRVSESIGCENLLKMEYYFEGHGFDIGSTTYYKLINPDRKTISDQYYEQIVKVDDNTIYATRTDIDAVDIYDRNGEYVDTLEIGTVFMAVGENNPLIAVLTPIPHFLNAEGKEIQYEEYINILPLDNYWIIENSSEEFALMDESGKIRIPYGKLNGTMNTTWTDVKIEGYNGEEIDEIYTFKDVFCIVTTNEDGSNVYLF